MTTLDDTRHCPMCEDAAKKILELEQRVKVLADALNPRMWNRSQSYAWHSNIPDVQKAFDALIEATLSPETDLDEALRRQ